MSKVLKILTIVSFLSITLKGVHVGGPLGFFLLLGLFQSDDLLMLIASIVCLSVLAIFVYSIFKPLGRRDFLLFVVGGIILLLPTGWLVIYLIGHPDFIEPLPFLMSLLLFVIFWIVALVWIHKTDKSQNK